jgi:branched-chain amino acid transport system ATP-binding protein
VVGLLPSAGVRRTREREGQARGEVPPAAEAGAVFEVRRTAGEDDAPALRLQDVGKSFGDVHVLEDVDLQVTPGERVGVIGLNGAGKTTLFQVISGVYLPSSGRIELFGINATRLPASSRATLGLARTFQITLLYPKLTTAENIALALLGRRHRRYQFMLWRPLNRMPDIQRRVDELLAAVGLADLRDVEVRFLSYGHQRQAEVALALASDPALLLLDEPTAGLAQAEMPAMLRLLKALPDDLTILVVEHNLELIFEVVDRVVVLHQGKVLLDGSPREVQADPEVRRLYLGSRAAERGA